MIQKRHLVSIFVNGSQVELYNQESLNLRINNLIYDPTKISSKTSEYSFSFNLPITKINSRIFNYANNLSKLSKFNKNYDCIVYADGIEVFSGKLRISSINNESFKCNLISIKLNKVEEIFGETKMNELRWEVPFLGIDSIESVNWDMATDYYFPLVSYGVFQKKPQTKYNTINSYTPKHTLDKYLQLYVESFPPSLKLTELIKRLFIAKGYDVQGNIFEDEIATSIYISEYLKDKQDPLYNYGSDLGKLNVSWNWRNVVRNGSGYSALSPLYHTLNYPYEPVGSDYYNFNTANIWDCWSSSQTFLTSLTYNNNNLFRQNCIVAPSDGMYKITMEVDISIANAPDSMAVTKYSNRNGDRENTTIYKNFNDYPVEVQLVRNTNECELIHGYTNGYTVYPHEAPSTYSNSSRRGSSSSSTSSTETEYNMGYMPKNNELLCYDPNVSPNFIVGVSSIGNCPSVMKNGYSWSSQSSDLNNVRYNCNGYWGVNRSGSDYTWTLTEYNKNTLPGAPSNYMNSTGTYSKKGKITCIMELKKNDVISLKCVCKNYEIQATRGLSWYDVDVSGKLTFEAFAPDTNKIIASDTLNWNQDSTFDVNLNLGNFLNADEKQSDFINNFIKAFNLSYKQEGNTVYLNKQLTNFNIPTIPVDIDNHVNSNEAESNMIDYPTYMQVKFSIDEEEAGFYDSVPYEKLNDNDWKDYGETGSEKIELTDSDDSSSEEISLNTSYTWYSTFKYVKYDDKGNQTGTVDIQLPIISKDEYMIEGYKYEDSMKVDGKGLKQRWWFRQPVNNEINFPLTTGGRYYATIPIGEKNDFLLNYKNQDNTLLTRFFNVIAMSNSNFVTISCYLSPQEYRLIKNGGLVKFDDDSYIVSEITGYDPTGNNKTKLTLIKKV